MENDSIPPPLLLVKNLTKKYLIKKQLFKKEFFYAVKDVSFFINDGEIFGLVGESGSGKSTIGRILVKLIQKDEGKVFFAGKDYDTFTREDEKVFRRKTSIIFQDPRNSLNPRLKIREILEEPLIVHKFPKKERQRRVEEAIVDAGLDESFLDRYPTELSGGQRQRVAIARAIVLRPLFIVADEPTSALDVSIQLQIINLIKTLREKHGISFLFISHDLNVVGLLSERVAVLYRGKIMEMGYTDEVLKNPLHPYTKLLIASLPPKSPRERKPLDFQEVYREDVKGACLFYHRCPDATDICKTEPPVKKLKSREVYCHFV